MTVDLFNYKCFLQKYLELVLPFIDEEKFKIIKNKYEKQINSVRIFEKITDLYQLFNQLEKRLIIQYDQIDVLIYISKNFVKNKAVENLIAEYLRWFEENKEILENLYTSGKILTTQPNNINCITFNNLNLNFLRGSNCSNSYSKEIFSFEEEPPQTTINISSAFTFKCVYNTFKNKKRTISLITIFTIFFLLLYYTWNFINVFHEGALLNDTQIPETSNHLGSNMPYYSTNFNFSVSSETRFSSPSPPLNQEKIIQDIVINKISKKIGKYWNDVARRLNIRESTIDKIEQEYYHNGPDFEKMFKKAMDEYFLEPQPKWKTKLKNALDQSRRRDLKDEVDEILDSHLD